MKVLLMPAASSGGVANPVVGVLSVPDGLDNPAVYNAKVASFIFALTDRYKTILLTMAGAGTATIPPNVDVAFPVGTRLLVYTLGAGIATITAGAGVTLAGRGNAFKSAGAGAFFMVEQVAADSWVATGDLTT